MVSSLTPARVFIVEDESIVALDIEKKLARLGYEVVGRTPRGEDAVHDVKHLAPDIILMDIRLAGELDGIEAALTIRTFSNVPIVFLTAYADEITLHRALQVGPYGYIIKPFDDRELRTAVEVALYKYSLDAKLLAQKNQFEHILQALTEGVFLLDPAHCIVLGNANAWRYLNTLAEISSDGKLLSLGNHAISTLCSRTGREIRQDITINADTRRIYDVTSNCVAEPGEIHDGMVLSGGWIVTIREVTQEREAQERIRAQDRLAAMGQLAAGIAHDFNNILASVILKAQLVKSSEASLASKSKDHLTDIYQQARRASDLVNQILDYSRASVVKTETLDMIVLLAELKRLLDRLLPENIRVEVFHENHAYLVDGDRTRLLQMLMNLAINARDAMPSGGTLTIEYAIVPRTVVEKVASKSIDPHSWLRIKVSDSGTGIEPSVLPHIFDPFFSTKPPGKGTGLGLAQVYGIVQQHAGFIDVVSQVGRGTSFVVYVPLSQQLQDSLQPAEEQWASLPETGHHARVLLVEDDQMLRETLVEVVRSAGYAVIEAAHGQDALQRYHENQTTIRAVVTDLTMPVMGGLELGRELRKLTKDLPILVLSGYPSEADVNQMTELGIPQWIQKPVNAEVLLTLLSKAIDASYSVAQTD